MIFAPDDRGFARGDLGAQTPGAAKRASRPAAPSKLRAPRELGVRGGPRLPFASPAAGFGDAPTFSPGRYRSSYALVPFAPNPLVSSPYPATPEYSYLYTPALIARAPAPLKSYKYRADNSYLLKPSPTYQATAWSYQWRRSPAAQTAVRAARSHPLRDEPAASRNLGQKIDDGLRARAMLPRDETGSWRPSAIIGNLELDDIVQPPLRSR